MTRDVKLSAAAKILGYHTDTLKSYIRRGKLRAFRGPGGHFRVSESEIERFRAERGTCKPSGECHA
jgi:excisionase family DNA binding protein